MAFLAKSVIAAKTKQLEPFYEELKTILKGEPVDADIARYLVSSREAATSIVSIDIDKLLDTVGHIKVILDSLRRLNSDAIKPTQSPRFFDGEPPPF